MTLNSETKTISKKLGYFSLWAIGVSLVISGESFGWNIGWAKTGPIAFFIPVVLAFILYYSLVQTLIELACVYPEAAGPHVYVRSAFGRFWGAFIALAILFEFLFASPAIAASLGEYICFLNGNTADVNWIATGFILFFCLVNIFDVEIGTKFIIVLTFLAILELSLYAGSIVSSFKIPNFVANTNNRFELQTLVEATPFAIWMLLGIEGLSLMTHTIDEKNFRKNITLGYQLSFWTLVLLAVLILVLAAGGIAWDTDKWEIISQDNHPMPASLGLILDKNSIVVQIFTFIGLFGLIASLHAITLAATNQVALLISPFIRQKQQGRILSSIVVMLVSSLTIWTSQTSFLIELSVFGAVCMYFGVSLSLIRKRFLKKNTLNLRLEGESTNEMINFGHHDFSATRSAIFVWISTILSFLAILILSYLHPSVCLSFVCIGLGIFLWLRFKNGVL